MEVFKLLNVSIIGTFKGHFWNEFGNFFLKHLAILASIQIFSFCKASKMFDASWGESSWTAEPSTSLQFDYGWPNLFIPTPAVVYCQFQAPSAGFGQNYAARQGNKTSSAQATRWRKGCVNNAGSLPLQLATDLNQWSERFLLTFCNIMCETSFSHFGVRPHSGAYFYKTISLYFQVTDF